jgi:hypothetical protein
LREAVFAYGSLVDPESAGRTLGRAVQPVGPVALTGWRRRWSLCRDNLRSEKSFAVEPGGEVPPFVLGLDIARDEAAPAPNGVLIELSEGELERLDRRELRYDRVEVTEDVEAAGFDRIWTYAARAEHRCAEPPPGAVILATYAETVERAFEALGPAQLSRYRETTEPPPVRLVDARLVEDRIPPGNPRSW